MRFTVILLFVLSNFQIQAQKGIDFFHGTWEEALEEAKAQDKLINNSGNMGGKRLSLQSSQKAAKRDLV